ncbi:sulfate transporter [Mycobacterium gordonae]|uniref:Sulfate transporter n=1 Tax=Mycobacterium gordonae TaxID=1778 RepID=A0A0Q2RSN1_MYCGO|nr:MULTISPECIES: STAS domain-containing protein [Mycobacterium]KQH78275.1 sulfate transporter [Mycobacterium gordonae]MDP7730392.1 STAS domain-containing protein [Mycobacterium sp. TY813]
MTTAITSVSSAADCNGAQIRAHCRHLATVVTIRGEIDAFNVDQVGEHVRRFVLRDNPVVLDLSAVTHFSSAGIALFCVLDEECRAAGVEWMIVANPVVNALLGDSSDPAEALFPVTRSVHEALRYLADGINWRRQLVLPLVKKSA